MINIIGLGGAGRSSCEYMSESSKEQAQFHCVDKDDPEGKTLSLSEFASGTWLVKRCVSKVDENFLTELATPAISSKQQIYLVGLGGVVGTNVFLQLVDKRLLNGAIFVCFLPFNFEGKQRMQAALEAVDVARTAGAELRIYPNQELFKDAHPKQSFTEAFRHRIEKIIDDVLV